MTLTTQIVGLTYVAKSVTARKDHQSIRFIQPIFDTLLINHETATYSASTLKKYRHCFIPLCNVINSDQSTTMRVISFLAAIALCSYAQALTSTNAPVSRQDMMKTMGGVAAGWMLTSVSSGAETTPTGVKYEVIKAGTGPKPDIGQLIGIRFIAFAGANKIDDIFDSPEPYYTRVGSGNMLKGVETTLPLMVLGDRWKLTIPVRLDANSPFVKF
jgi:hypothetical protein